MNEDGMSATMGAEDCAHEGEDRDYGEVADPTEEAISFR
jgi:hypothetical protein